MANTSKQPKSIVLSLRIYRWLLSLGPEEYQGEYGQPTLQVFLQYCRDAYKVRKAWGVMALWPRMFSEVVMGMVAEHLALQRGLKTMQPIMRRAMIVTFAAFMVFALAFTALMRLTDPRAPFNAVAKAHTEVRIAFSVMNNGAIIAFLAIVLGGIPVLVAACNYALIEQKRNPLRLFFLKPGQILAMFSISVLFTIGLMIYFVLMNFLVGVPILGAPDPALPPFVFFLLLLVLGLIISLLVFGFLLMTTALALVVKRGVFDERLLRLSLLPIAITTIAMGVTLVATCVWIVCLIVDAPEFARSGDGLGQGNIAWLVAIVVAMLLATGAASVALKQGLQVS